MQCFLGSLKFKVNYLQKIDKIIDFQYKIGLFNGYNFDNTLFNPNVAMTSENSTSNINRSTNTSISSKKLYSNS